MKTFKKFILRTFFKKEIFILNNSFEAFARAVDKTHVNKGRREVLKKRERDFRKVLARFF